MVSDQIFQFNFEGEAGERLDKFLVTCMPEFTRTRLQNLVKDGFVLVNGKVVVKTGIALLGGEQIKVIVPPAKLAEILPEAIPLHIVFENSDLMVINKAAGMVVHPAAGHAGGTLVNAALAHDPELEGVGGEQRPGVVHRLDKDTSGLIIMAKNDQAHNWLQEQFKDRKVYKTYLALVDGHPPTPRGRIEAHIGRDPGNRKKMAVVSSDSGREAVTEYRSVHRYDLVELLEAHPITGRTHQIRVHLAFLGCPVVGDTLYGRKKPSLPLKRHFLHAARLTIALPGEEEPTTFEAPLPFDLEQILINLTN